MVLMTKVNPYDGKFLHQSNTVCKQSCTGVRNEFPVFGIQVLAGQEILETDCSHCRQHVNF